jgi:MerR family transcriptional regulator, copper efflux regulator
MTIGRLSRLTGVAVKNLREYEQMGLIYTVGRSDGNYRLFGDEALWCVQAITGLRDLGLTLAEIQEFARAYLTPSGEPIGPRFAALLDAVRIRSEQRIDELKLRLERLRQFQAAHASELAGTADFELGDPRRGQRQTP